MLDMKSKANIENMDLCGVYISLRQRRLDCMLRGSEGTILDVLTRLPVG